MERHLNRSPSRFNTLASWWLTGLVLIALLADVLANDRPLVALVDGEWRFPVARQFGKELGWVADYRPVVRNWYRQPTEWAWWPPVPYRADKPDRRNANYRSPLGAQQTGENARHWLGTDKLGRDVLAGLIRGTRVAVAVGLGSLLLAFLIGISLGGIAGFFGNQGLVWPRYRAWGWGLGAVAGAGYGLVCLLPFFGQPGGLLAAATVLLAAALGGALLSGVLRWVPALRAPQRLPADGLVLQLIELFVNVPGLVFLIALLAIVDRPSIGMLVLVIGLLRWPTIARFLRAELLRIRTLPYIEAAHMGGVPPLRVLFRHALPNALGPLLVVAGFSLGDAVLLEASLSFLGIGVPPDQVTWGSLLRLARDQPEAWWLAVFPGLCLTFTVLAANRWYR